MVTERVDIVVNERGATVVRRNIEDIGAGARRSGGAVNFLRTALIALGGAVTLRALGRLLNTFQNLRNRLRTVTEGTAQLNLITEELLQISNRTRSSFEGSVELFARTSLALKELGVSQRQTLQFTESLNQAVLLSGASAAEAQNAIIQLSQGLASGTLRGDELRSVLEQLPVVADVIAEGLGVTRGELRELGAQGRITAQDILRAFAEARVELGERFAETVPTIGQSFQVLQNNLLVFLGRLDDSIGVSRTLSRFILNLADSFDTLSDIIAGLAPALDLVRAVFEEFEVAIRRFIDFVSNLNIIGRLFDNVTRAFRTLFGEVEFSLEGILRFTFVAVGRIIGAFRAIPEVIGTAFNSIGAVIQESVRNALNAAISLVESGINRISGAVSTLLEAVGLEGIDPVSLGRIENTAAGAFSALLRDVSAIIRGEVSAAEADALAVLDRINARREELANERSARAQQELIELEAARAALEEVGQAAASLDGTIREGITAGLAKIKEEFQDLASVTTDLLVNSFGAAEDALVNFVRTGKLEFNDLVNSILDDLTRLIVRQAITAPLAGLVGGAGGIFSSIFGSLFGGLPGFANGASGVPVDAVSVASLPGRDNRLVMARMRSDETIDVNRPGQGGGVNVNITVVSPDADSFRRSSDQIVEDGFRQAQRARRRFG